MTQSHGFELLRDEQIEELNTRARTWRHVNSGAELLSLENDDENKVFGISFPTPPEDSTGIAHIMEHAVLGGSRKYQVKEPFVELVKGSLKTFLNAMTFSDKTIYPVASTNLQDYYNLVDVYLDAVFFPLITPHHLQQEGWHFELDELDAPLTYKGVVFNEMKGVYSSPDNLLQRYSQQTLFPDNTYQYDSGGDPSDIPDLTYEQFKSFHDTFYHPSNSLIFMYGDDDPQERLRLLDAYLSQFSAAEIDSAVALQTPFSEPRRFSFPYTVEDDQGNGQAPKSMIQVNWLLPEFEDPDLVMALSVLSYALISTPASPLRKALIDSGLGEDVTGGGMSTYTRQMTFSVGMKGVVGTNVDQVEQLILETLQQLAKDGIDPDMVDAALNSIEFALRENNTGSYPRGLSLMVSALNTWLHGRDPLLPLRYEKPLEALKSNLEDDNDLLRSLILQYLVENPHRATVVLDPDPDLANRWAAEEKARLQAARDQMSEDELRQVINNTQELLRLQETPDSPEALASLPMLTLADLDKENKTIPIEELQGEKTKILFHDLFTNGIAYLDVGFDLHTLPQELLPFAGLFGRALVGMGTESEDFVKLSQRIGRKTGGISPSTFTSAVENDEHGAAWLFLSGKATMDQTQDLLDILQDILLTVQLDNPDRFRQIVLQAKARHESGLIPSGHLVVNTRLRARFNKGDWAAEQIGGLDNLYFLRELTSAIENDWSSVLEKLEDIRRRLLNRQVMIVNVTLDDENWRIFRPQLDNFLAKLPANPVEFPQWTPPEFPANEGLTIPAHVNYVAKGGNLYQLGYQLDGSMSVITNSLRTTWLWEKIRVQGGAYGGFCLFRKHSGVFTYLSYRDPNLTGTLHNYDGTANFLRHIDLSDDELTKSIIGAIGSMDSYQLPDAKGFTSMQRYLIGETDAARQKYRDEVLTTTVDDFRALADYLEQLNQVGQVVVLGSAEAINSANEFDKWLQVSRVM
ncbi:MAG: insulinase family protein [Candidatus Promineifilaceae bacterium]|nr:insulinase family protein [Candidatus Promineifilaceae bacterium]